MSDDKLNEVANDGLFEDSKELFNDISSSASLEKIEESKGPKRIKKEKKSETKAEENKVEEINAEEPIKIEKKSKKTKIESDKHQNEQSKAPKSMKDRYVEMLQNKKFEVRFKGSMIYDSSSSKVQFSLTDTGIMINNNIYKYSDVVIRMKS